mmetsp:Transcript_30411/g.46648  ORF Transcript_30411/g.46648 Transcript_30411/m.46648 type:complete len:130 (-) Transcript_30411:403-792(-)
MGTPFRPYFITRARAWATFLMSAPGAIGANFGAKFSNQFGTKLLADICGNATHAVMDSRTVSVHQARMVPFLLHQIAALVQFIALVDDELIKHSSSKFQPRLNWNKLLRRYKTTLCFCDTCKCCMILSV